MYRIVCLNMLYIYDIIFYHITGRNLQLMLAMLGFPGDAALDRWRGWSSQDLTVVLAVILLLRRPHGADPMNWWRAGYQEKCTVIIPWPVQHLWHLFFVEANLQTFRCNIFGTWTCCSSGFACMTVTTVTCCRALHILDRHGWVSYGFLLTWDSSKPRPLRNFCPNVLRKKTFPNDIIQ